MTSMPASRSARAITLAPRSWPSRPGFATRTRIFCSAAVIGSADCLYVEAPPQIPTRNAAIRLPTFGDLLHLLRSWQRDFHLWRLSNRLLGFCFAGTVFTLRRAIQIMLMHRHADA